MTVAMMIFEGYIDEDIITEYIPGDGDDLDNASEII